MSQLHDGSHDRRHRRGSSALAGRPNFINLINFINFINLDTRIWPPQQCSPGEGGGRYEV